MGNVFEPKMGDLIMVRNSIPPNGSGVYYTQRYVLKHKGRFYCERDDGDMGELIGWDYAIPNQGHDLIEKHKKTMFDYHYVSPCVG